MNADLEKRNEVNIENNSTFFEEGEFPVKENTPEGVVEENLEVKQAREGDKTPEAPKLSEEPSFVSIGYETPKRDTNEEGKRIDNASYWGNLIGLKVKKQRKVLKS